MNKLLMFVMVVLGTTLQAQSFSFTCEPDDVTLIINSDYGIGDGVAFSQNETVVYVEDGITEYIFNIPVSPYFKTRSSSQTVSSDTVSIYTESTADESSVVLMVTLTDYNYDESQVFSETINLYDHITHNFTSEQIKQIWDLKNAYDDLHGPIYNLTAQLKGLFSSFSNNQQAIIDFNSDIIELNEKHDAMKALGLNAQVLDASRDAANEVNDALQVIYQEWLNE